MCRPTSFITCGRPSATTAVASNFDDGRRYRQVVLVLYEYSYERNVSSLFHIHTLSSIITNQFRVNTERMWIGRASEFGGSETGYLTMQLIRHRRNKEKVYLYYNH